MTRSSSSNICGEPVDVAAKMIDEKPAAGEENAKQVIVTINGPGEISGWLVPFANAMKLTLPGVRICVALLPCTFAAGTELQLLKSFSCVDAACSAGETLSLILRGRIPRGFCAGGSGIVLHMGGDPIWAWLLAKRLKQPCAAYVEGPFLLQRWFRHVFFAALQVIPENKRTANSSLVGDLVVDAAWMTCPTRDSAHGQPPIVSLYPGSRDYIVMYSLPFLAEVVDLVSQQVPGLRWQLAKADFLSHEFLRNIPDVNDGREVAGKNLSWNAEGIDGNGYLITQQGNRIDIVSHKESAASATLAITFPGTTTAELAALGVPMLVILPLMHSDKVPIPGPLNYVDRIPLIGKRIKQFFAHLLVSRLKFTAQPNRRARRMVVPEMVGFLTPDQVATQTVAMIRADTSKIAAELRSIMGEPGAAQRLVAKLRPYFEHEAAPAGRPAGEPGPGLLQLVPAARPSSAPDVGQNTHTRAPG